MRIIVIGAVAAGTSAAAKARRSLKDAEIVIYEQDTHISYSACGIPYYIGGEVADINNLAPRDATHFKRKYNIDILTSHKVLSIDKENKSIEVKNLETGETFTDNYDKLVIATGASPFMPDIEGHDQEHVFTVRNINDAINIKNFIETRKPKNAVVVGSGFIGLEILENLVAQGLDVHVIESSEKLTANLDNDMSEVLEYYLINSSVRFSKSTIARKITKDSVILSNDDVTPADIVIIATGIRPNVEIAERAGIELGETGAIKVDCYMETSDPSIFACGDCIETFNSITGKPVYRPLGSTANKTGRIAGENLAGGTTIYKGNLSTAIFRLFNITIASTGLSEREAKQEGFKTIAVTIKVPSKPSFLHGKDMTIKAIADTQTSRLLGVQIVGFDGVDKRIDVFATLLSYEATVDDLYHLDLAYSPPYSTAKDGVHYIGMVLENAIRKVNSK